MVAGMSEQSVGRELVAARSDGDCEVAIPGVCQGRATTVHHRRKRSQGGGWGAANLLALCGSGTTGCHGWVEANPKASREWGWWIFTGDGEPNTVSVFLHAHTDPRWCLLDDRGSYSWVTSGTGSGSGWPGC